MRCENLGTVNGRYGSESTQPTEGTRAAYFRSSIRVAIGNDKAITAYRGGKPFPEGTIIGRVAWKMVPSEENNKTFGQAQSFVPGDAPDWYLQFLEKDTKKYAATGGWGYSNFDKDLKPLTDEKIMYSCYTCHKAVEARDYIFTKYAP